MDVKTCATNESGADSSLAVATVPAKLIFFGEYGVIFGGDCVVAAINRYGLCQFRRGTGVLKVKRKGEDEWSESSLFDICGVSDVDSEVKMDISSGSGLGGSAMTSLVAAVAKEVSRRVKTSKEYHKKKCDEKGVGEIYKDALDVERVFHGVSSNVDVTACYTGGLIHFKSGNVEKIDPSNVQQYKIMIYDSKIKKSTKAILNEASRRPGFHEAIEKIKVVSKKAYEVITGKNAPFRLDEIYKLISIAEECLESIGVVPEEMKMEVERLKRMGIASKVVGSGGGGHTFTIVENWTDLGNGWEEVKICNEGFSLQWGECRP